MLQPVRTTVASGVPVWQFSHAHENAQGGFVPDTQDFATGDVIVAGTPIGYDEAARTARPIKQYKVHANASNTDTDIQIEKGSNAKVGDKVGKTVGGAAYAISAIVKSNADYDVITVGTTLGVALTAGDVLYQSSATGASAGALLVTPKGLLYEDMTVGTDQSVSVAIRGTIYARRIPGQSSEITKLLPNIIFSQSY